MVTVGVGAKLGVTSSSNGCSVALITLGFEVAMLDDELGEANCTGFEDIVSDELTEGLVDTPMLGEVDVDISVPKRWVAVTENSRGPPSYPIDGRGWAPN
ncbi:hypothetical protein FGB62_204g18 [Gracilaria domingensis]|nr:hypothetical protein FGB62_204g18 [Gracilaria domingensis]